MKRSILLASLVLVAACGPQTLSAPPGGDGYGPAGSHGGGSSSTGQGGSSSSTGAPTGSSSPPPPSYDAGTGGPGGPSPTGYDAGTTGPGAGEGGALDAGRDASSADGGGTEADASTADLLALCVSQVNQVRDQNGAFLLQESTQLEAYATSAVASDANDGVRHSYFNATGGGGVAQTEDELDGDQVDPGGSAEQTFEQGLQQDVEDEGQALDNLVDEQFTQVGCGFAQDTEGNWWVDIALR